MSMLFEIGTMNGGKLRIATDDGEDGVFVCVHETRDAVGSIVTLDKDQAATLAATLLQMARD